MAIEQNFGDSKPPVREWVARGAGAILTVVGVGIPTAGVADFILNTAPEQHRLRLELDQKYPLIGYRDLEALNRKIDEFENKTRELIIEDQAGQIPQLVQDTQISEDYKKVDLNNANNRLRRQDDSDVSADIRIGLDFLGFMVASLILVYKQKCLRLIRRS